MNYQLHYNKLIERAKLRMLESDIKIEQHHIIPRSMGGDNSSINLVNLTLREHYIAHHLLWKIYRNQSMAYAFWNMCNTRKDKEKYITSRTYETIRMEVSVNTKKRMSDQLVRDHLRDINTGHIVAEETREKISLALTGKKQTAENIEKRRQGVLLSEKSRKGKTFVEQYGEEEASRLKNIMRISNSGKKQSKEAIDKRVKKLIGHEVSESTREKISKANSGNKRTEEMKTNISLSHMGLKQSEESKKKKSIALKNRPKSEETKQKMRKPKSEEHKRKISETKQRKKLEKLLEDLNNE